MRDFHYRLNETFMNLCFFGQPDTLEEYLLAAIVVNLDGMGDNEKAERKHVKNSI